MGKPADVQRILDKLNASPENTFTKKEDSLLLRAFMCRSVTDPKLKVIAEEERSVVNKVVVESVRPMFDDYELLAEVACCVVNLDEEDATMTGERRARQDDLVNLI